MSTGRREKAPVPLFIFKRHRAVCLFNLVDTLETQDGGDVMENRELALVLVNYSAYL